MSDIFPYRSGDLHAEDVPVSRIAAAVGTPFYLYSTAGFTALYRRFAEAFAERVARGYEKETGIAPKIQICTPAGGATLVEPSDLQE